LNLRHTLGLRQAKSRESPAIAIIEALRQEGTEIVAFDPAGIERKLCSEAESHLPRRHTKLAVVRMP